MPASAIRSLGRRRAQAHEPVALRVEVVTDLDVDVQQVLARRAVLGDLLEDELGTVCTARRYCRPVLLEIPKQLVPERRHPEVAERIDVVGIDHDVNGPRLHTATLANEDAAPLRPVLVPI